MKNNNNTEIKSRILPWFTKGIYFLGAKIVIPFYFRQIKITGQENIPSSNPVIIAPMHRSRWDALLIPYATGKLVTGKDLHFMVSANEMKGLQGWVISRVGGFPINTEHPGSDSLRHSVELLCQGEMIVIFPEGGIFRDQEIHKLKPGVARIALEVDKAKPESGIKILPVSIKYSQSIPTKNCDVEINIGSALNVADYNNNSLRKDTVILTKELQNALEKLL
jgi:1-acyl-sn-glycerol-3-phosphate acyltransferase